MTITTISSTRVIIKYSVSSYSECVEEDEIETKSFEDYLIFNYPFILGQRNPKSVSGIWGLG